VIQPASYDIGILRGRANSADKGGSEEGTAEATAAEPSPAAEAAI